VDHKSKVMKLYPRAYAKYNSFYCDWQIHLEEVKSCPKTHTGKTEDWAWKNTYNDLREELANLKPDLFVSYTYNNPEFSGFFGTGNCSFRNVEDISSIQDIKDLGQKIEAEMKVCNVVVMNFRRMEGV
jgi:hypothetical protein